jgi:hypothetical protein
MKTSMRIDLMDRRGFQFVVEAQALRMAPRGRAWRWPRPASETDGWKRSSAHRSSDGIAAQFA